MKKQFSFQPMLKGKFSFAKSLPKVAEIMKILAKFSRKQKFKQLSRKILIFK
jgi:hypothetical protein